MGCSVSRLQDAEAVQLCKDRTNFIKQALQQRSKFASGHIEYIQSLERVSMALHRFINGDYKQQLLLPFDPYITPPLLAKKRPSLEIHTLDPAERNFHVARYLRPGGNTSISVQQRPPPVEIIRVESHCATENDNAANFFTETSTAASSVKHSQDFGEIRYMKSNSHPSVTVQERHQPAEAIRIESYFPMDSNYVIDGRFFDESSYNNNASSSYDHGSGLGNYPPSPQNSHWDFFWNPFSSLDNYTYLNPSYSSYDRIVSDDDVVGLQLVREQEGIPELEDDINSVELESAEESDDEEEDTIENETERESDPGINNQELGFRPKAANMSTASDNIRQDMKGFQDIGMDSVEVVSDALRGVDVELKREEREKKNLVRDSKKDAEESKPGFTVYMNRRPLCLAEVMREIQLQFQRASDAAHEITGLLEAGQVQSNQLSSTPSDLAAKLLNPVALLRSGSSRSSSSRFILGSTGSREDTFDTSSCFSDDSSVVSTSHRSTLDRLYVWEKKLYHEVKTGEKIKVEYEKKLHQLRSQDVIGEEPSSVDRTRTALQNLHTRLKVSFHSVQSISRRIETLRDEELYPQLMDLLQGIEKMWRAMAECHRIQKRAIDEAKPLIFCSSNSFFAASSTLNPAMSVPPHVGPAAAALEAELRTWSRSFAAWVCAQRAYAVAMLGWAQRCCGARQDESGEQMAGCDEDAGRMFRACWRWARGMDGMSGGAQVMDGLDFFAAGIGSVCTGLAVQEGEGGEEGVVQMAGRVVFAGLSVAVSALADYAGESGERYGVVVRRCKDEREGQSRQSPSPGTGIKTN
ncbi:DUF630 family protein (DUF630 and DUF632) [Rhynchospora pubera]|uniref:DUF630 family protein (DUF630 and DUF632) n=1 Tax=Rhynchospora pubera TaxID=906938 RepID=A0AAV8HD49_9POAL|nr:DUF630 family protein (DUF630 and DUF632) [Rhynchospora pubera]